MGGGVGSPPGSPPVLWPRSPIIVEGIPVRKNRRDNRDPYVGLSWEIIDSPAWKTLGYEAVWFYVHLKRQFTASGGAWRLILPYGHVNFRMTPPAFRKACAELIRAGFIILVQQGGLGRKPNIYALSEKWRETSAALLRDPSAGHVVRRLIGKLTVEEWQPLRKARGKTGSGLNVQKGRIRVRPSKSAVIQSANRAKDKGESGIC